MKSKAILTLIVLIGLTALSYKACAIDDFEKIHIGWTRDSVINFYFGRQILDGSLPSFIEDTPEKMIILEKTKYNQESKAIIYFNNGLVEKVHLDFYGSEIDNDPIKSYFDYVESIKPKVPGLENYEKINNKSRYKDFDFTFGFELYLRTKDKTFKDFNHSDAALLIKNNGAQIHAVSHILDLYKELVLLYVDGSYHMQLIYDNNREMGISVGQR